MEADPTKAYNQDAATGFIRLNALRLKGARRCMGQESGNNALVDRKVALRSGSRPGAFCGASTPPYLHRAIDYRSLPRNAVLRGQDGGRVSPDTVRRQG